MSVLKLTCSSTYLLSALAHNNWYCFKKKSYTAWSLWDLGNRNIIDTKDTKTFARDS